MTRSPNPAHLNIDCTTWQNVYRVDSFGVGPVPIEAIVACVRDRRQQSSQRTKVNAAPNRAEGVSSDEDGPEPVRACAPAQDPDARRRLFPLTTVTTTRFQLAENPEQCHETNDSKEYKLADFERVVVVLPKNDPLLRGRPQRGFVVCTHAVGADQRETVYVPRHYDLSIAALRRNQPFLCVDVYMDGAEYLNDHSAVTCGVRIANAQSWALHKDEAHHVFAVVGPNIDMAPILARLSLDLQVLDRGYEVMRPLGKLTIFGGLGLVRPS